MTQDNASDGIASQLETSNRNAGRKLWRTALLLAGSAAFGGLAVAFWNRKTLAELRKQASEPPLRTVGRDDDIY